LANGAETTVHVGSSGTTDADDVYAIGGTVLPEADELALYINGSNFQNTGLIRAYLRYQRDGAGGGSRSREGVATAHDPPLWTMGDVIEIEAGDEGFAAIGDVTTEGGYAPFGDECL
jgi:hypothetical protein